ncbi:MAG: hypothetical protein ABR596_09075 [Halarsenatibacteraceae bacterium]
MSIEFNLATIIVFMLGLLTDHFFKQYSRKKRRQEFVKHLLIDMNNIYQGFERDVIEEIDMSIWEDVEERFFKAAKDNEEYYHFYDFYNYCYEFNNGNNQEKVKEKLLEIIEETFEKKNYKKII